MSARELMRTESTYCWAILSGGRFSELRPIYEGCRALTFALARLSCYYYYFTNMNSDVVLHPSVDSEDGGL